MKKWTLVGSGWSKPPAWAREIERTPAHAVVGGTVIEWEKWSMKELLLSPQAAMLVVQGLPLQKLFEHSALVQEDDAGKVKDLFGGPFLLVKAEYKPYEAVPCLRDVVLTRPPPPPPGHSEQEVIGAIVQAVLSP